jgi:excisionase family DNA binding protein
MAADSREVMNIRQASQYLGVSPDTLYKYVTEEKIPAFKLGNRWKFKKTILDQWMEQKSTMNMNSAKRNREPPKRLGHGRRRETGITASLGGRRKTACLDQQNRLLG